MIQLKCQQCGKKYFVRPCLVDVSKYCSRKCKNEAQKRILLGKNNPNWKGGERTFNYKEWHRKQAVKWRKENPEKVNAVNRKYYRKWAPKNRERLRQKYRLRHYKVKNAPGSHTLGEWELLKKQYDYTCPACGRKEPEIKLTEDHIIPITRGGSSNIENIQPLCRSCNCSKHTNVKRY